MTTSKATDKKTSTAKKIAGAVGLAAGAAAIAAAGYYFYGKGGKERRKELSDWGKKAHAEILEKIKRLKVVTKTAYDKAVNEVMAKYQQMKNISPAELKHFGEELKTHWTEISKEAAKLSAKTTGEKTRDEKTIISGLTQ